MLCFCNVANFVDTVLCLTLVVFVLQVEFDHTKPENPVYGPNLATKHGVYSQ